MPIVNTFETDKFHTLTNRLLSKQKFNKQTSAEVLKTIEAMRSSNPGTSNQKISANVTTSNLKLERSSVMKLDSHMQTRSGDNIYLSSTIIPNIDLDEQSSNKKDNSGFSSATIALQTSEGKLHELKAMHKRLVNLTHEEPNKPKYEPRKPTLESIRHAIERAKREDIDRHKSTGTDDLLMFSQSAPVCDAITCTDSKAETTHKSEKKVRKVKTTTKGVRIKKKKKKSDSDKCKFPCTRRWE